MADLLSEAIADAKKVKSAAIANAKLTLEEAFQPTLQRMISTKLAEEEGEGDDDDIDVNINFGNDDDDDMADSGPIGMGSFADDEEEPAEEEPAEEEEPTEEEDDMELESLIRELEGEDMDMDMDLEEASTLFPGMDAEDDMMDEGEDDWSDPIPDAIQEEEMDFDEDELSEAIQSLVEEEMEAELEDELTELFEADGEFDLEDDLSESDELETMTVDEGDMDFDEAELEEAINEILGEEETVDVNIDEEYSEEDEMMERNLRFENRKLKGKLTEAYRAVTTLKNTLNDVNLLNAKLMYTTKTFQQFELNESQKHRVLDAFDRANSVREVKLVYTTICESRSKSSKPNRITEGFASKSQNFIHNKKNGTETRSNIVEGSVVKWNPERLQQLAGMRKLDD